MAEIREELTLVDKFSDTFNKFNEAVQRLVGMTDRMEKSGKSNNKEFKDMNDWFGKNNDAAQRLADRGLDSLTKRLMVMAGAYVGIRKLTQAIQEAGQVSENAGKLGNYVGNGNLTEVTGYLKTMGNNFGVDMNTASMLSHQMSKVSGLASNQEKMMNLAQRLASITPGQDASSVLSALTSSLSSRNIGGFIQQYGLNRGNGYSPMATTHKNFQLQLGGNASVTTALNYLDELSNHAGATQEALERMWDNPHRKMQRLANIWNNELTSAAQSFMTAIKPALDKLEAFFQSQQFQSFMGMVSQVFAMFGKLFEQLISKLVANAPMITDMLAKAFTVLYNVLGWVIDNFDTIAKVVAIAIGLFVGWKIAITGVTTALSLLNGIKLVFSNPFTAVIAGALLLVAVMAKICNPDWTPLQAMLVGIGVFIDALLSPFKGLYDIITGIVDLFKTWGETAKMYGGGIKGWWTMFTKTQEEVNADRIANGMVKEDTNFFKQDYTQFEDIMKKFAGLNAEGKSEKDILFDTSSLVDATMKNIKALEQNTEAQGLLSDSMDPDAWMRNFGKIAQGKIES